MPNKKEKSTINSNKAKNKKAPTIELDNGEKVLLRNAYMKNTKNFKI